MKGYYLSYLKPCVFRNPIDFAINPFPITTT
jgi:hypothetical protein